MIKIHVLGDDPLVIRGGMRVLEQLRPKIAMVFDPPKWDKERSLLNTLSEMYFVHEIIESPFLLRKIEPGLLGGREPTPLFLTPRRGMANA